MEITDKINELASNLKMLKEQKEGLEEQVKNINSQIRQIEEFDLPKMMEDADIENIRFQGIGLVFLQNKVRVSVLAENKPEFIRWAKENGHADLVKEDVHSRTLESWGKEMLEENNQLPEVCKVFMQTIARIRK